jgi:predicted RNA-binding protein
VNLVVLQYIVSDIPHDIANMSESVVRVTKPLRLVKATNVLEPMDIDTVDGRAVSKVDLVQHAVEVEVPD